jgi:hypothetical protein
MLASSVFPAVSSSGSLRSLIAKSADFFSSAFKSRISPGVSEKKAFSAAEVTVEIANIITIIIKRAMITPRFESQSGLINLIDKLKKQVFGSGSKC